MAVSLFGWEFTSKKERERAELKNLQAVTVPDSLEGATEATAIGAWGGQYGIFLDTEGTTKNDVQLITLYRTMASYPEVDYAVDDIVNEAIVITEAKFPVSVVTDAIDLSDGIKGKITIEFERILELLDFNNQAYQIFRRWYVDGRLFYNILINTKDSKRGIQELRYIDPRKIKKVREIIKAKEGAQKTKVPVVPQYKTYYLYNQSGFSNNDPSASSVNMGNSMAQKNVIPLTEDSVSYTNSGLLNASKKSIISHLHKAIKPWNQLKLLEDATVICRISRAPERRIFYVDVGNLPKIKAEQYLKDIMTRFKNKVVYNATTGEMQDGRQHRTMLEDYWLPRREGGKGTEITTLPGGTNLGEIEDVLYFRKKLNQALNVPRTRLEADTGFSIGRDTEITRDEVKFGKMVSRLRNRFVTLFIGLLEKQLLLKGIILNKDWDEIKNNIRFDWQQDTHFIELQETEMLKARIEMLTQMDEFTGTYFSQDWIRKNVLRQTESEIADIQKQIENEKDDGEGIPVNPEAKPGLEAPQAPEPPVDFVPPEEKPEPAPAKPPAAKKPAAKPTPKKEEIEGASPLVESLTLTGRAGSKDPADY